MQVSSADCVVALDSSGPRASVALLRRLPPGNGGEVGADEVLEITAPESTRASSVVHELLGRLAAESALSWASVGLFAAVRGPGSFTGLRVGLSAVAGLALATGSAAVGVETTASLALASGRTGRVAVALDGGQGRVFMAEQEVVGGSVRALRGPEDVTPEEALARAGGSGVAFLRAAPGRFPELLAAGFRPFDGPVALAAARIARATPPALLPLEPLYARAPAIRPPSSPAAGAPSA